MWNVDVELIDWDRSGLIYPFLRYCYLSEVLLLSPTHNQPSSNKSKVHYGDHPGWNWFYRCHEGVVLESISNLLKESRRWKKVELEGETSSNPALNKPEAVPMGVILLGGVLPTRIVELINDGEGRCFCYHIFRILTNASATELFPFDV